MKLKSNKYSNKTFNYKQFNNIKEAINNNKNMEIIETDQIYDLYYQQYEVLIYKNDIKVDSFYIYLDLKESANNEY